ncbi:hypothetical protein BGCPKDLD_2550 [Methylorubrum suomiense]|uniref:Uncharacterized protein n=1 Tax=Methylorubrum suomiense TaxID=144191 RepID=A0ABQ4UUH0_9HYPH|nr:hypothetical protein BGCPKDLD_2550 [Methylorubrum suomiense]
MTVRRTIRGSTHGSLHQANKFLRFLSVLLISTIGLGIFQTPCASDSDDDADREERVVFRHYV